MIKAQCVRCGQLAGWLGVWVNVALGIMKVCVGFASGSHACVADALASGLNVFIAFSIFIARKITSRPVDDEHAYGYGKAEYIAAGSVAVVAVILTLAMMASSLVHIIYKPVPPPHLTAGLVALVSVGANEMLFRYFRCVGTELRSQTIIANAWANRGEAFGSSAVLIGVVGAQFGFNHLDPIASLVVSGIILKFCTTIIWDSIGGLMDRSPSSSLLERIRAIVNEVESVDKVRQVQARQLGDKIWVDLVVSASKLLTVRECEEIRALIEKRVRKEIQEVGQILVDFETP